MNVHRIGFVSHHFENGGARLGFISGSLELKSGDGDGSSSKLIDLEV